MNQSSCSAGTIDCLAPTPPPGYQQCADYDGGFHSPAASMPLIVSGSMIAIVMSICIGGNDAANAWGATVGSGAIPLRRALLIGGFGEWLGATLLGAGVSNTIQKGVSHPEDPACWACGYCDSRMSVYAVGMLAALIGACVFLLLATFGKMPVSTTHAIVGGVVGMTMVGTASGSPLPRPTMCLDLGMAGLGGIVASWVISPLLAGAIAGVVVVLTDRLCVRSAAPVKRALLALPCLYALTTFLMVALTLIKSKPTKEALPFGAKLGVAALLALLAFAVVRLSVVPRVRRSVEEAFPAAFGSRAGMRVVARPVLATPALHPQSVEMSVSAVRGVVEPVIVVEDDERLSASCADGGGGAAGAAGAAAAAGGGRTKRGGGGSGGSAAEAGGALPAASTRPSGPRRPVGEEASVYVFRYLLVFVAFLESFAHGANDTANATSAFAAVWKAYSAGLYACANVETQWWIMSAAGLFVAIGVNLMGYRVIQTIGEDLTPLDYQIGFAIELAATITVVIATLLGFPVSTTHCKVGAVVFAGFAVSGRKGVDLSLFGKIVLTWVATLPFAGALAAGLTAVFTAAVRS